MMKYIPITLFVAAACSGPVSNAPKFPVTPTPHFNVSTFAEVCGEDCEPLSRETREGDAALAMRAQKALFAAYLSGTEERVCPRADLRKARGLIVVTKSQLCGELCDQPNVVEVGSYEEEITYPKPWARIHIRADGSVSVGGRDGVLVTCAGGTDTSYEGFHQLAVIEQDGVLVFIPYNQGYASRLEHVAPRSVDG